MSNQPPPPFSKPAEERLLILAPTVRDGQLCRDALAAAGLSCVLCADLEELCSQLQAGAAAVLLSEEAFAKEEAPCLQSWLQQQPAWGDLPILLLTHAGKDSPVGLRALELLGNVLLLERPLGKATLVSAARSSLRERKRQYQIRAQLEMLKQAREAAEEGTRAKSEFLANMSHEIRTPMTIFLSALEHLQQIDNNPEHQKLLQMADKSAKHLRDLIDDILDFSRIESGVVEVQPSSVALGAWLEDVISMFQPLAREKNLKLTSCVRDGVPAIIETDATRLKQMVTNLIGNAIKFTHEGEINVTVKTAGEQLEFVIADTGIGIPKDKQHLLFQSFSQLNSFLQRDYGGTGLGLAITRKLAELMGGRIAVRSREGAGSVFTLILPLRVPTVPEPETSARPAASLDEKPSCRILLAEDDPMIRELFTMKLERRGWLVEPARSGEEALEMWALRPYDVILMDLQMPGMDGLEATRQIRAGEMESNDHVSIVGVTAHARRKVIQECLKEGMDEVVTKPVKNLQLEDAVLKCIQKG